VGEEPDPRWTLANERTLLAYERTALGLFVAGLAVIGSRAVADAPRWLSAMGLPSIVLGAAVALEGRRRFVGAQRAMRTGDPLEAPAVAAFLPWSIAAVATVSVVAALVELASSG
jgi:putative membrane protein